MSRIDISVREKESGNLIANRGFCRSSHLSYFCESFRDAKLMDFADELFIGVNITADNIEDFLNNLEYTVSYLERANNTAHDTDSPFYNKEIYLQFLNDLKDGLEFLQGFKKTQDLQKFELDII